MFRASRYSTAITLVLVRLAIGMVSVSEPEIRVQSAAVKIDQDSVAPVLRHCERNDFLYGHSRDGCVTHVYRVQLLRFSTSPALPRVSLGAPLASGSGFCASETRRARLSRASGLTVEGTGTTRVTWAVPSASM